VQFDPERIAECQRWLRIAIADLGAARKLAEGDEAFLGQALFFCQQGAEKVLKAFLTWNGQKFRNTHSIEELGQACIRVDATLAADIDRAAGLTSFVAVYRYPGIDSDADHPEFERAMGDAQNLVDAVLIRLPNEVKP
jgi:HEPN domain-containing protein